MIPLSFLKYYKALEWESRFTLGLNTVNNNDYIEKCFKQNCTDLNFLQKTQWKHISIYSRSGGRELQRFNGVILLEGLYENERYFTILLFHSDLLFNFYYT